MQRGIVALLAAAVVVLGALVLLVLRVRGPQETVVPEEALTQARANFERSRSAGASAASATGDGALARPPDRPAEVDRLPAGPPGRGRGRGHGSWSGAGTRPRAGREGLTGRNPGDPPADPGPGSGDKRQAVAEAYDQGDFETAFSGAEELLQQEPGNEYVRRVAVVSACAIGNEASARRHFQAMNQANQLIVARRCARFGVTL